MQTFSYSESLANYEQILRTAVDDHEEVIITRSGQDSAVIVSLDDYNSLKETAYLMRSPKNARRILDAIERLEAGGGTTRELLDDHS